MYSSDRSYILDFDNTENGVSDPIGDGLNPDPILETPDPDVT